MESNYRLFNGSLDDAASILNVEAACWNESPHTAESLHALLESRTRQQACWLAEKAGDTVGFVHALLIEAGNAPTWEIDLLAVVPAWRGKGVGSRLLRAVASGAPARALRGRGLVAASNAPSAGAFNRAGFTSDRVLHEVFVRRVPTHEKGVPVWPGGVSLEPIRAHTWRVAGGGCEVRLHEVHTILHNGLWIDGFDGQTANLMLRAALRHAFERGLGWLDVILPEADNRGGRSLRREGFRSLGGYLIWTCLLPLPE